MDNKIGIPVAQGRRPPRASPVLLPTPASVSGSMRFNCELSCELRTHVLKKEDDLSKRRTATELGKRITVSLKSKAGEFYCGAWIENRADCGMGPIHIYQKTRLWEANRNSFFSSRFKKLLFKKFVCFTLMWQNTGHKGDRWVYFSSGFQECLPGWRTQEEGGTPS